MNQSREAKNKALVSRPSRSSSTSGTIRRPKGSGRPDYVQHSAHIAPGRDGPISTFIKSLPATLKIPGGDYRSRGDIVIVHGRFSGFGAPVNWIAAESRIDGGVMVEHWDVIPRRSSREAIAERPTDVRGRIPQ